MSEKAATPDANARRFTWDLTFDMSGGAKGAKRPLGRPLDGGVRHHGGNLRDWILPRHETKTQTTIGDKAADSLLGWHQEFTFLARGVVRTEYPDDSCRADLTHHARMSRGILQKRRSDNFLDEFLKRHIVRKPEGLLKRAQLVILRATSFTRDSYLHGVPNVRHERQP